MKRLCAVLLAGTCFLMQAFCQNVQNVFVGRWDITVTAGTSVYPDWMEVVEKAPGLDVRIQPRAGSVRPAKDTRMEGSHLILTLNPGTTWDVTVEGDRLSGGQKRGDKVMPQLAGGRAPDWKG